MAPATKPEAVKANREWLGLKELTAHASVSDRTLRAWIHRLDDPLPAVQVDGKILVRRSVFDAWLERFQIRVRCTIDVDGMVNELVRKYSK